MAEKLVLLAHRVDQRANDTAREPIRGDADGIGLLIAVVLADPVGVDSHGGLEKPIRAVRMRVLGPFAVVVPGVVAAFDRRDDHIGKGFQHLGFDRVKLRGAHLEPPFTLVFTFSV